MLFVRSDLPTATHHDALTQDTAYRIDGLAGSWTWTLDQLEPFHICADAAFVDGLLGFKVPTAMQKADVTHETPDCLRSGADTFGATVQCDAVTVAGTVMGAAAAGGELIIGRTIAMSVTLARAAQTVPRRIAPTKVSTPRPPGSLPDR